MGHFFMGLKDFILRTFAGSGDIADVATESAERRAMQNDLDLIADIRGGAAAIRQKAQRYLPQYEGEDRTEYARRVAAAPWRPEFNDALLSLASKPFSRPVTVADTASAKIKAFAEDVDGRGNNLHTFAREAFLEALSNGVHLILVDYPRNTWGSTLADERRANPKPYWCHVHVANVVSIVTDYRAGREIVTHLRIREWAAVKEGFGEKIVERIRVIEPDKFELYEKGENGYWLLVDRGDIRIAGDRVPESVPVALLFCGKRTGSLQTRPPLIDLAEMQLELFRAMSHHETVLTYASSPMLQGRGMALTNPGEPEPRNAPKLKVGPRTVLFTPPEAPAGAGWGYVEPNPENVRAIAEHVDSIITNIRHLGMQPTTPKSGGITATAAAIAAAKSHSALESWALGLKDALEQAFRFTEMWLGENTQTGVIVHTDFGVELESGKELTAVIDGAKNSIWSKQTAFEEAKRRNVIATDRSFEEEQELVAGEQQGLEPEDLIDPRSGLPIQDRDHEERLPQ